MTLYLAHHCHGYFLTHDATEHEPGCFVTTLCGCTITMPLAMDEYDEARVLELTEDLEMCAEISCVQRE